MKSTRNQILLLIAILTIIVLSIYYGSYWFDLYKSPWAYSRNPEEQLLIGKWGGHFTDPNDVKKHLNLTILVPTTNEQRWDNAFKFFGNSDKYSHQNYQHFDGIATVKSKLGTEEYELSGHVDEEDFHQLYIDFDTKENKPKVLSNFILSASKKGNWHDEKLNLILQFSYLKANGSGFWDSAIPKYSAKINCELVRVD